jgi:hypothetical protein
MERREGFLVVMGIVKFRRACKRLPALETPDVMPVLALIESLEGLSRINMGEGYANRISNGSICSGSSLGDRLQRSESVHRL